MIGIVLFVDCAAHTQRLTTSQAPRSSSEPAINGSHNDAYYSAVMAGAATRGVSVLWFNPPSDDSPMPQGACDMALHR
jgi:hypothetical protein